MNKLNKKFRSLLGMVLFLCITCTSSAQNRESYNFSGEGFVYMNQDVHTTLPGEYVYPGEELVISYSGRVRHNWEEEEYEKCFIKLLRFKCKTYTTIRNHYRTQEILPPKLLLYNAQNQEITGGIQLPPSGSYRYTIPKTQNFADRLLVKMIIAPKGVGIDRDKSDGHYKVSIKVNPAKRLDYLEEFLRKQGANITIQTLNDIHVIDQHLIKYAPVKVAELIIDLLNYHTDIKVEQTHKILEFASTLAPSNPSINISLAEVFRQKLDYDGAEEEIKKAINLLEQSGGKPDQLAVAYEKLGLIYFEKREGLISQHLVKANSYLITAAEHYRKAIDFEGMIRTRLAQAKTLNRMNTLASLEKATQVLEEVQAFASPYIWFKKNEKYGFANQWGKLRIKASYDEVKAFAEYLAPVKVANKWGYVDKGGAFAIAPKYDEAFTHSEGLAKVKIKDRYGFIDRRGELVIPAEYDSAYDFKDGIVIVSKGMFVYYLNKKGDRLVRVKTDNLADASVREYTTRDMGISFTSDEEEAYRLFWKHEICQQLNIGGESRKTLRWPTKQPLVYDYILLDEDYNVLDKKVYGNVKEVGELVYLLDETDFKYIKPDGAVLKPEGTGLLGMPWGGEGMIAFAKNNLFGFWNKNGKIIIAPRYKKVESFQKNLVGVLKQNNHWAIINKAGKELIELKKDKKVIRPVYPNPINEVLPPKLTSIGIDYDHMGIINNETGATVIPFKYSRIGTVKNKRDLIICTRRSKGKRYTAVLNLKGEAIIPESTKSIDQLENGFWVLTNQEGPLKGTKELYDLESNRLTFKEQIDFEEVLELGPNRILIHLKDSMYVVDKKLEIKHRYKAMEVEEGDFLDDVDAISNLLGNFKGTDQVLYRVMTEDEKTGLMDNSGKMIFLPNNEGIFYVHYDLFLLYSSTQGDVPSASLVSLSGDTLFDNNVILASNITQELTWTFAITTDKQLYILDEKHNTRVVVDITAHFDDWISGEVEEENLRFFPSPAQIFDASKQEIFSGQIDDMTFAGDRIYFKFKDQLMAIHGDIVLRNLPFDRCQSESIF